MSLHFHLVFDYMQCFLYIFMACVVRLNFVDKQRQAWEKWRRIRKSRVVRSRGKQQSGKILIVTEFQFSPKSCNPYIISVNHSDNPFGALSPGISHGAAYLAASMSPARGVSYTDQLSRALTRDLPDARQTLLLSFSL